MTELLYFTAVWCVPCRTFGPVMDGFTELPVRKFDVDVSTELTRRYGVMSVPTVIAVNADGDEIARFSGARTADYVSRFVNTYLSS